MRERKLDFPIPDFVIRQFKEKQFNIQSERIQIIQDSPLAAQVNYHVLQKFKAADKYLIGVSYSVESMSAAHIVNALALHNVYGHFNLSINSVVNIGVNTTQGPALILPNEQIYDNVASHTPAVALNYEVCYASSTLTSEINARFIGKWLKTGEILNVGFVPAAYGLGAAISFEMDFLFIEGKLK